MSAEYNLMLMYRKMATWRDLARAQDQLLAAYRAGTRPSGSVLDAIRNLKEQLNQIGGHDD